ncbi:cadherin domain-containing protein [Schlesneria paludicola]|uniref:cadherin domain-containing protein n=1 Tax=Schlesneria paludicola TaxID=360056 RepID=UPI00029AB868|nr:cadherin domain-containing protein [Schlesneria paludicola]
MVLSSWLTSLVARISATRTASRRRHRRQADTNVASIVELLEQRRMLTPVLPKFDAPYLISETTSQFPYPTFNQSMLGQAITSIPVSTTGTAPVASYTPGNMTITGGNTDVNKDGNLPFGVRVVNGRDQLYITDPGDLVLRANPTFTLTLTATDNALPTPATATTTITVQLLGGVNHVPIIPQWPYTDIMNPTLPNPSIPNLPKSALNVLQINENSAYGARIQATVPGGFNGVTAFDQDAFDNDPVTGLVVGTYEFVGPVPGFDADHPAFSIDPFTGAIYVIDPTFLDYEARAKAGDTANVIGNLGEAPNIHVTFPDVILDVRVKFTDRQGASSSTTQFDPFTGAQSITEGSHIYIRLRDVGETPPDVSKSTKSLSVNENSPPGLILGYFQLVNGYPNFTNTPNRIAASGYWTDANTFVPFDPSEPQQRNSFYIVGGNTYHDPTKPANDTSTDIVDVFGIDPNTGAVYVKNQLGLNFELQNVFSLQIAVMDDNPDSDRLVFAVQNVQPLTTIATLNINVIDLNENTTVPSGQVFNLPENSADGTIVGTVIANDPDLQKPNGLGELVYSIVSGNRVTIPVRNDDGSLKTNPNGTLVTKTYDNIFTIDPKTGVIKVKNEPILSDSNLKNSVLLDFENQPTFSLVVKAVDRGDAATSGNATVLIKLINVNEKPPTMQPGTATTVESTAANPLAVGQSIINIAATVGETNNRFSSMTIVDGNLDNAFQLIPDDPLHPTIWRIAVLTPNAIDYELHKQFVLTIKATDNGSPALSTSAQYTINVVDVNEQITIANQSFTVNENSANGTTVGTILTDDPDNLNGPVQTATFQITGGNVGNAFSINAQGQIKVNNSAALDFETTPIFTLIVSATDSGSPATTTQANITINLNDLNDAPTVPTQTLSVAEHSLKGTLVGKVTAIDVDRPAQTLTYTIVDGNSSGAFSIDSRTGNITVNDPGLIDFATKSSYLLKVTVSDNGSPSKSATGDVTIQLLDKSEPQLADKTVPLADTAAIGSVVTKLVATGGTTPFTYSILGVTSDSISGASPANVFMIDPSTGEIKVKTASFNYKDTKSYTLKVLVVDGQSPSLGDTATITVQLTHINVAPVLSGIETTPLAYTEKNTTVLTGAIVASDIDSSNAKQAVIQITSNYLNGQDQLLFTNTASITGSWNASSGTLTLSGIASLSDYQAAIRSVTYKNLSSNPNTTSRTVSFTIRDEQNLDSNTVKRDIKLTAVNDAPVLASSLSALSYGLSAGTLAINPQITVNDVDNTTLSNATITLTGFTTGDQLGLVLNGSTMGNISIVSNASGILKLTSSGGTATLAQWQAALRAVTFTNSLTTLTTTSRTVSFVVSDGSATNPNSNTFTTTINIKVVQISGIESTMLDYTERTQVPVSATIQVTDPFNANLQSATIKITGNYIRYQDFLLFTNTAKITGSFNDVTGTLTLTGTDTVANYTAALRTVKYYDLHPNPSLATRTVAFSVTDAGGLLSNVQSRDIKTIPVEQPPVASTTDTTTLVYTEGSTPVAVFPNMSVTDPETPNAMGATIKISGNYNAQGAIDKLNFVNTAKITASWNAATGTLTLTGVDSFSNYRVALRSVTFSNSFNAPNPPNRTITATITDQTGLVSNSVSRAVQITKINAPSVLAGIESIPQIFKLNDPNTPAPFVSSTITVADNDSPQLKGATIQITKNYISTEDKLTLGGTNPKITASWDSATGVLTLTGTDTVANYQAALRSIIYNNSKSSPNVATRTITFKVTDTTDVPSNAVSRDMQIRTTNVAPTLLTNSSGATSFVEKGGSVAIVPGLTIKDEDSPYMIGAVVKITANAQLVQEALLYSKIGNINGVYDSTTGTLTLSGKDTAVNYQAALRSVRYSNLRTAPTTLPRTISITVNDGLVASNTATQIVTVQAVNDPPVIQTNSSSPVAYKIGGGAVAVAPTATVTDPDDDFLAGATIKISVNYQRGVDILSFVNTAKIQGTFDPQTGTLTLTGTDTVSNYRAAIQSVKYLYGGSAATTKTLNFQVTDGKATSNVVSQNISINP